MTEIDAQAKAIPPSPYANWLKQEGVPVLGGLMVKDIKGSLPMRQ